MSIHVLGLELQGRTLIVPAIHRRRALSVLTQLQSASAAVLAAFGVVHLSAPLVGLLHLNGDVNDRVDAVSRWMLLGRVAYQSGVGEAILWASLGTHLATGVAKRLLVRFIVARSSSSGSTRSKNDVASAESDQDTEKELAPETRVSQARGTKLNIAQRSGYLLAPFAIHHAFVNRILPSSTTPPISGLSPSELDYSSVSHSLSHPNIPVRLVTAVAYTVLIGAFAVHTTYALPSLLRALPGCSKTSTKARRSQGKVSTSVAALLLASLLALIPVRASDRLTISNTLKDRYDAVLRSAFPTRFFF